MHKAIQLEFLKFRTYKPFWIILGLYTLAFFAVGLAIKSFLDFFIEENASDFPFLVENGLPLFDFVDIWQNLSWITFLFKYILAFVVIISVCVEFANKTAKQNLIDGLGRHEFLLSKIALAALLSLFAGILLTILGLVLGLLYSPVKSIDFIFLHYSFVLAYVLEVFAFLTFALLAAFLIRRTGFTIVVFVLYTLTIEPIGTELMEHQFHLQNWYLPTRAINNLIHFPFQKYIFREVQDDVAIREVFVVCGWIVIFLVGSYLNFKRRDV